jgi:hypothetical protein
MQGMGKPVRHRSSASADHYSTWITILYQQMLFDLLAITPRQCNKTASHLQRIRGN